MASINSHADFITHGEGLLEAVARSPQPIQVALADERQELEVSLGNIKTLKARQEELNALRLETTQQLSAAFQRGKDAAMTLRAVAKGKLGPRNERLAHFNVAPVRQRSNKAALATAKKPAGEASGTTPGAVASPGSKSVA